MHSIITSTHTASRHHIKATTKDQTVFSVDGKGSVVAAGSLSVGGGGGGGDEEVFKVDAISGLTTAR